MKRIVGIIVLSLMAATAQAQYTGSYQTNIISGVVSNWSGNYVIGTNTLQNDVLLIQNAGVLSNANGSMGASSSSNNIAVISGAGSAWRNGATLSVGTNGAGNQMTLTNGGTAYDLNGYIGGASNANNNAVLVTGMGSVWTNSSSLYVGNSGAGSQLTVVNSGRVFNANGYVGCNPSASNNAVTLTGAGSVWANSSNLYVGTNSVGNQLTITNSGTVYDISAYIGCNSNANNNTVLVTGTGSLWTNSNIYVGSYGSGNQLTIASSGAVFNASGFVGYNAGASNNAVTVTGAGSVWSNIFSTYVGNSGSGNQLTIASNGGVIDPQGFIGYNAGASNNTVTVTDAGSVWANSSSFYVGYSGAGNQLTVTNGGRVVTWQGYVGYNSSASNNMVLVTGGGVWTNYSSLYLGYSGTGNQLTIASGGAVYAPSVTLGYSSVSWNNVLAIRGGSLITTNTGYGVLDIRRGAMTLDGGTIQAQAVILTNGLAGTLSMSGGNLWANTITNGGAANVVLSGGALAPFSSNANWSAAMVINNTVIINTVDANGQARSMNLSGALSGGGQLNVIGTGTLLLNGSDTGISLIQAFSGVTLGGVGSVANIQIQSNATLAAGSLSATNLTLNGWAHIHEGLYATSGVAGINWDLISVAGSVSLSGVSSNTPLTVDVVNGGGLNGSNNPLTQLSWTFLTATGGISGFDPNGFAFTTAGLNGWSNGIWAVLQAGNSLQLQYTSAGTVTVLANPMSGGFVTGGGTFILGSNDVLMATASNGWEFVSWSDGTTNNPYSITIQATNLTLTANFTTAISQFNYSTNNGTLTITGYTGTNGTIVIPCTVNGLPVTSIGDNAFTSCSNLTSVTIPSCISSIGQQVFLGCTSLTAIMVDSSNSVYGSVAGVLFDVSRTTLIQYPPGLAGSYTVPAGVTNIGAWAFAQCTSLTSVTLPASVTGIGQQAFLGCTSLTAVYCQGDAPSADATVFQADSNVTVYYELGKLGWGTSLGTIPTALWQVTVTTAANPAQGGLVIGSGTYPVGTNVQLAATASNGWLFTSWNDGTTNTPYTVTVPAANITYTANFAPTAVLTVQANPANGGSVMGGGTYLIGNNAQISAAASNNWLFINWNDGVTTNPRTVVVPAGGVTYTANFVSFPINDWLTTSDGTWLNGGNWSLTVPPAASQGQVQITNANSKTVTLDASVTNVPSALTVSNLLLSAPVGTTNTLSLSNVETNNPLQVLNVITLSGNAALVLSNSAVQTAGVGGGSNQLDGTIILKSSTLLMTNVQTSLGYGAQGQLTLSNSTAWVRTPYIGYQAGGMGTVLVNGSTLIACSNNPSTLGNLYLGYLGSGNQVTISNGGTVNDSSTYIGCSNAANNNSVMVAGAGSVWSNISGFYVGNVGVSNQLTIANSGRVVDSVGSIGNSSSASYNAALVTDAGSVWSNTSVLYVGNVGTGNLLTISNSGRVVSTSGYIGNIISASSNTILVTGAGSVWTNTAVLYVGGSGAGNKLAIANGGRVFNTSSYIGSSTTASNNTVLVTDAGSVWTNTGVLYVGSSGAGNLLTIANSGIVINSSGYIGQNLSASNNMVAVTGGGSVWSNTSSLYVGSSGSGNLMTISNGSVVYDVSGYVGGSNTANNAVLVTGAGSVWNNNSALYVGATGAWNQVMVTNGGTVYDSIGYIGGNTNANNNTAQIAGAGSVWNSTAGLYVGYAGASNQMTITSGGAVNNTTGYVGNASSASNNVVTVTGAGSIWNNSYCLYVGATGAWSQVVIGNGGTVATPAVILGLAASSSNNALSIHGGSLIVTNAASGVLDVRRGAVSMDSGTVQAQAVFLTNGLNGTLSMSGGSLMANTITNNGGANIILSGGTLAPLNSNANWSAAMVLNNTVTINTVDVNGQARSVNLSGALSGGGQLNVIGSGTLLLNGSDTGVSLIQAFSGVTLGGAGAVANVQIQSNATLAAGNLIGTFAATNLTLNAGAHLQVGLNATSGVAGVDWDLINVAGWVTLSGISSSTPLIVNVVNGGALTSSVPPATALSWQFLTAAGGISGFDSNAFAFTTSGLAGWSNGIWAVTQASNSLQLLYTPPAVTGTVSVLANPTIGGSVTGGGSYLAGSSVVLTAVPSNNWAFINWNDGATNNPYTITVPLTNVTFTANFAPMAPTALPATNVTLNSFFANWVSIGGATNYLLDVSTASSFSSFAAGYNNLSVGMVPTYQVSGLNAGATYYYRVREQQGGLTSDNSSTASVMTASGGVSASSGPGGGGNTLTITGTGIGSGSDITNVTICGVAAAIQGQTANSVTVIVGAGGSGIGSIQVWSSSGGLTTLPAAYTYNPQGTIAGTTLSWSSVSNLPVAINTFAAVTVSNTIYAIGGQTHVSNWTPVPTVYVYDALNPAAGWGSTSNLQSGRQYVTGAAAGNKLYAMGGYENSTVFVFDTLNPTAGWSNLSALPSALDCAAAAVVNGKIYVTGGVAGGSWTAAMLVYDPAQPALGWVSLSSMPAARRFHTMTELGGKLYVVGGEDASQVAQTNAWTYDPAQPAQGWLSISNLPAPRSSHVAGALKGILFAIAGRDNASNTASVLMYDPARSTLGWQNATALPLPLSTGAGTVAGGAIYEISGGYGSTLFSNVFKGTVTGGVGPNSGNQAGGDTVTIAGNNLGNHDVTSVTLCGIVATILTDNSPTQLVVSTGAAAAPGAGDVVVTSTSYGTTTAINAYTYNVNLAVVANPLNDGSVTGGGSYPAGANVQLSATASNFWHFMSWNDGDTNATRTITVPATNITFTANFSPPSPTALTATSITLNSFYANWGAVGGATNYLLDVSVASNFASYVSGYSNLTVGGVTTYQVSGLFAGMSYYYRVREQQGGLTSVNSSTVTVATASGGVSAANGPGAGGNTLTISGTGLGNGSDITNVTICGVSAAIQSQTANSVTVIVGFGGKGLGAIVVSSISGGVTTLSNAYTYGPGPVVAWGYTSYGATNVPSGLSNVVGVVAGTTHAGALLADGTVRVWGTNSSGQTNVPSALTNIVSLGGGGYHLLALRTDGTVAAWGGNYQGETNVPAGLNNVIAVAQNSSGEQSLALRRNGTVVAWGANGNGQTNVPSGLSNVVSVAGGGTHSMALRADGTVVAWGNNTYGATNVPSGLSNVVAIAGGGDHSMALCANGTVVAWGRNTSGETNVPPGLSNVMAIAAGTWHSVALQSNGIVVAWGDTTWGESTRPPGLSNVVAVSAGYCFNNVLVGQSAMVLARANPANGGLTIGGGVAVVGARSVLASVAATGWAFLGWSDGVTDNPRIVPVLTNITYTANFTNQIAVPVALAATNITLNSFYANWGAVSGATNYLLDVSPASNFASYVSGYSNLTVGTATTYQVSWLNAGAAYYFRVREQLGGLISDNSATVTVATVSGGVSASSGPGVGGNTLTISGPGIGNGSDITNVTICGVSAAIHGQTANSVTVLVGVGGSGIGKIQVYSISVGLTTLPNAYTYNPQGSFSGVSPASGAQAGGETVAITGRNLGSHDVTSVTLCGMAATILTDNSPTQLVVSTGAASAPGTGDVVVTSTSYGTTTGPNLFTYNVNLTVAANPASGGSVTGGGSYPAGSNVQVTATVSNSWLFTGWNDGDTNTSRTVTVPATNITYTANFAAAATISLQASTNAGGSLTGSGVFIVGSNDMLTATASNGWRFISWSDGVTNNPRTIVVSSNSTYMANFAPTAVLTVQANPVGSGSVTGGGTYVVGSDALLSATASNLWCFIGWDDSVTNNPRTVVVPSGGATYTANFGLLGTVSVLANPTNGGSVTGGGQYLVASNATVTATASNNWLFLNWDGSTTNNPWVFPVVSGTTICTANFARLVTVSVQASTNEGGTVTGSGVFVEGSNDVLTATASNGWQFSQWSDGVTNNPRTIVVSAGGASYTAVFSPVATITAQANPAEGGDVTGGGSYVLGSNAVLTATASYGWKFTQWNDGITQNPRAVTVTAGGGNYTANFIHIAGLVQVQDMSADTDALVSVPVILVAQSNENAVSFSLTYDNTILTYSSVTVGSNAAAATIMANTNQLASGRLGIALALSSGSTFDPGTQQIALISFKVGLLNSATSTVFSLGDQPILRQLVDNFADSIPCVWSNGTLTLTSGTGYEGDVAPRPNGNGTVSIADWVQVGRFAAGLDTPNNGSEFQRADCAPRSTKGDGAITIADWVQAGRYAVGLDPLTLMGGPTAPTSQGQVQAQARAMTISGSSSKSSLGADAASSNSLLTIHGMTMQLGQTNGVLVDIQAQGSENALGFSLNFDPSVLNFVQVQLGSGAASATLLLNTNQSSSGHVGIGLALPPGQTLAAGSNALVTVSFAGVGSAATAVSFADVPVAREVDDASANTLSASYSNGVVVVGTQITLLTVLANPVYGGIVSGGGVYIVGTNAVLTATSSDGWIFTGWTDGGAPNPRTVTVPATNISYTANFACQYTFTTNNGAITITGYTGAGGVVTIPSAINGLPVTSIGFGAFLNCSTLTNVKIPASVTYIGSYAFLNCGSLAGAYFLGNVPSGDVTVFTLASNATVYYLQAFTDWGPSFGGRPTTLWQQSILATANPTQGGTVTGSGVYPVGTNILLTAVASNGWLFTVWNDGATNNPYSITVPATNNAYTATFMRSDSVGDGIPDAWRKQYFGGDGTTTNALSCATADPDGDGLTNLQEFLAGTNPNGAASCLHMLPASPGSASPDPHAGFVVQWQSVTGKFYAVDRSTNLVNGFDAILKIHIPATPPVNTETDTNAVGPGPWFYRVRLE